MSGRYFDYDKGSSRSTRDDSRPYKGRDYDGNREGRTKRRSRSRSPHKYTPSSSSRSSRYSPEKSTYSSSSKDIDQDDKMYRKSPKWEKNHEPDEELPEPPPPPRISKITIGFSKPKAPIRMSLGNTKAATPKPTVASVFNTDDDDEPEEMPAEAKMRMRNIGRETPTSAGPNSFGKTKQGFCDAKKVFEKNLKQALEMQVDKSKLPSKLPQTIYKIKGP